MSRPLILPPLDPDFDPAALWNRRYLADARKVAHEPLVIALEGEGGRISRYVTTVRSDAGGETFRFAERQVKFLLWARGGWRITIGGPSAIGERIRQVYSAGGERTFDVGMMEKAYGRPLEVAVCSAAEAPAARECVMEAGGHLDGCRIGFDLGASDYKVAAVQDGRVVYSDEFPWDPRGESNPDYHYGHLTSGIRRAAEHLPHVDAIGGSSAGILVNNQFMVASLLRSVEPDKLPDARNLFLRLERDWNVPVKVVNDGDVTALAGAMSLGENGILGVAMGSSEAAGYVNPEGRMTGWLSELAFAPVDMNPDAAADEWSGDRGTGVLYFSQQAVNRLLPAAGIALPEIPGLPERLKRVQELMAAGDERAERIYRTIGVYLGYSAAHYASYYEFNHLLILGRVTTGPGGEIILAEAGKVLAAEFPELAAGIDVRLPDERSRRVGQACAAASLPPAIAAVVAG